MLALTPAIIRSAKAVDSICKRIDWDTLRATQCDIVHLHFQSIEMVRDAIHMLLGMAAGDCDLRRAIVSRIERAFRLICPPVAPSEAAGKVPVPLSNSEVEKLLNDLEAPEDAANFADLCVRAWVLYKEIYREASEIQRSEAHLYAPLPPLPQDDIPPWLGPAAELWIGVPIGLVFAEPIVCLCRRIAENNTGITELSLEVGEKDSLQLHHRLWLECKPRSYRVPVDDFSHPICHQLQTFLDVFIPNVRKLVSAFLDQIEKDKHAEVSGCPPIPVTMTKQAEMIEDKREGAGKSAAMAKQAGDSSGEKSCEIRAAPTRNDKAAQVASSGDPNAVKQSAVRKPQPLTPLPVEEATFTPQPLEAYIEKAEQSQEVDRQVLRQKHSLVSIVVTKSLNILVTPKPLTDDSTQRRRALLALALVAPKGASEFMVDTPDFVQLTHGRNTNIPHDWGESAGCLRKLDIGVEKKGRLEALISGVSVTIVESVNEDMIRERLLKLSPASDPKPTA